MKAFWLFGDSRLDELANIIFVHLATCKYFWSCLIHHCVHSEASDRQPVLQLQSWRWIPKAEEQGTKRFLIAGSGATLTRRQRLVLVLLVFPILPTHMHDIRSRSPRQDDDDDVTKILKSDIILIETYGSRTRDLIS
ncbi:hypothetical protein MPTK1_1g24980 [Marchantia polymorpha subsp. ruderalis]|uniref:Uncharacterized protein n=2 Tax=Marchantia polymorpha TaxID=3197 RepID=A0AAF6AU16_MARPO|nr:hypothetical protein MARPO_0061s0027 [Marchantia polymorpha]BBM99936.1 hypothetical protein Mp_1g24980 [Marchantia polymorpha subsp. ruderalis]|eukprot:PTQ36750.1 hypothetical protein MARPO_0061s0027 [Marchantia polymorpha]